MTSQNKQQSTPSGWSFHSLGERLALVVDNRGKTPPVHVSGIPMAEVNAIGEKTIDYSAISKFVSEETYQNWFRNHLEKNDILFSTVGRTASCSIYTADTKTVIAQNLVGLRFKKDNPEFMFYLLTQEKNNWKFKSIEMSAAQPSVKVSQMIDLEFLIPMLPEQDRIVSVLNKWDQVVEKLKRKIEIKKKVKKGLMQELLTGKSKLSNSNGEWKEVKLGQVAKLTKGKDLSKGDLSPNGKFEAIHYGELFTKYGESIENIHSRTDKYDKPFLSETGDVLMPTSDVTPRGLSTASCIQKDGVVLGGDILVIRPDSKRLDGLFFSFFVSSHRKHVMRLVSGTTVFHLYGSDLAKLTLLLPDVETQKKITQILLSANKEIDKLENKLKILKDQKKYLLNNLITGTIRTPETLSTPK